MCRKFSAADLWLISCCTTMPRVFIRVLDIYNSLFCNIHWSGQIRLKYILIRRMYLDQFILSQLYWQLYLWFYFLKFLEDDRSSQDISQQSHGYGTSKPVYLQIIRLAQEAAVLHIFQLLPPQIFGVFDSFWYILFEVHAIHFLYKFWVLFLS